MTHSATPVGAREGQHTEFKEAKALGKLEPISTAVVSMLNASGGDVWIGVTEEEERFSGIEPIGDVAREEQRVRDHLISSIEPSPLESEARVERVDMGSETSILVVRVEAGRRTPYAKLRGGARHFELRVGARSRPMTRDEIAMAFRESNGATDELRTRSDTAWTREVAAAREELWVRIAFEPALDLPLDRGTQEVLDGWLRDPLSTGNRPMGWTFASDYGESFRPLARENERPAGFSAGGQKGWTWLEVRKDGEIVFRVPRAKVEQPEGELNPYALVEYPTSVVRLAAALRRTFGGEHRARDRVLVDVGLVGMKGLRIRPGVPGSPAFFFDAEEIASDVVRPEPHAGRSSELVEAPDALAWSALTALYFQLGFLEDRMPRALFDTQHRKLRFPK